MSQKTIKKLASLAVSISTISLLALPIITNAQQGVLPPQNSRYGLDDIEAVGLGQQTNVKSLTANLINIALGFLGIIAVIIIIYAGFKWMTAAGNEEQVKSARATLVQAIIGLTIIFLAWIIVGFAIEQLSITTGSRDL